MMMDQNAKTIGRQPRNPTRNQEMMMEQNAKRVVGQTPEPCPEPGNDDGTKPVSWKNWEPHSAPELFGEKKSKLF